MAAPLKLRFRVDFGIQCSVGIGKIELLEGIALTGSLSQAARRMRMGYRRAWLLLEDMNLSFDRPVALASVGGRGGGGVVLTALGKRLISGYRRLESEIQPRARVCLRDLGKHVRSARPKRTIPVPPIKGRRRPRASA